METLASEIAQLLNQTLSPDKTSVWSATEALDRFSHLPKFPLSLISIATGGDNLGQRIAAATYLKNFTRRCIEGDTFSPKVHHEFRNELVQALLQVEPAVLKVLVEAFRVIVVADFVKENSWPEFLPELRSVIQNSNILNEGSHYQCKTINALTVLQTIIKPFQYFLNPKLAKEPVPQQLELIAKDILVPLLAAFHHLLEKALSFQGRGDAEIERALLIICKCIYFSVRSHMPSALILLLPSFCRDLIVIMDSLNLDPAIPEDGHLLRLKAGKRGLLIFSALVTRHRKYYDKLMPNIVTCAFKIVKQSPNVSNLGFLSERIVSLAFDVISHVLETGPDISEWEDDADEYIRKNLPSDLDEISGWNEDLFTARKSALNLLGVISLSKGPPVVSSSNTSAASAKRKKSERNKGKQLHSSVGELSVIPFLSKFPIPSDVTMIPSKTSKDYYGVLLAYGALQDFLKERNPEYMATLVRSRVLPLYFPSPSLPYLVATANWVLGELASCLPQEMSADIYCSLLKALAMSDIGDISCYPVRASAAGAIAELLENDYLPPEWLTLLQVLVNRTCSEDENESSLLFQLLSTVVEVGDEKVAVHIPEIVSTLAVAISKHIPPIPDPWPQVVERGFAALASMAETWEDYLSDEVKENKSSQEWRSGWATIARTFSGLLQQAWLPAMQPMDEDVSSKLPPPSCINEASALLGSIMRFIIETDTVLEPGIADLLVVWADLVADWDAWEEMEDLAIFDSIQEVVNLHKKCELKDFFVRRVPLPPAPPISQCSIVEGIASFVTEAISAYPSATWRACSCAHLLLHVPEFSFETENVKESLVIAFTRAAFSRFRQIRSKPVGLWKPLLLVISSCYLYYPDNVENILNKDEDGGLTIWARALAYISSSSFEQALSLESEIKLAVMTLTKVVERFLGSTSDIGSGVLRECLVSLIEALIRLKEVQEEDDEDDGTKNDDDGYEDEETDDDEDSEDDVHEETEEEFLERYAKAAEALDSKMIAEEGDVEDQDQELELGALDEVDQERAALSLIERYHQVLVHGQVLPPQLITGFINTFPLYGSFFQAL
ncbi:ARM repeat superfamily protein isoform X2 [Tasmannia lanceolata]|uniref:ARM repeat superfamily protein isoform X2 n=1 Tax=Tasmannia lanceolata TaxID=3420 RepID=UPI004062AA12